VDNAIVSLVVLFLVMRSISKSMHRRQERMRRREYAQAVPAVKASQRPNIRRAPAANAKEPGPAQDPVKYAPVEGESIIFQEAPQGSEGMSADAPLDAQAKAGDGSLRQNANMRPSAQERPLFDFSGLCQQDWQRAFVLKEILGPPGGRMRR